MLLAPLGVASTMDSRFVAWRQLNVILISCDGLGQLRLSCINMCYHDDDARYQILELLAWSLEAMGSSAQCLKTTSANLY